MDEFGAGLGGIFVLIKIVGGGAALAVAMESGLGNVHTEVFPGQLHGFGQGKGGYPVGELFLPLRGESFDLLERAEFHGFLRFRVFYGSEEIGGNRKLVIPGGNSDSRGKSEAWGSTGNR